MKIVGCDLHTRYQQIGRVARASIFDFPYSSKTVGARPCVVCKGGYDAVCSMRSSFGQNRQRRPLRYPPFAKYAKDGAPPVLLMPTNSKAGPPVRPLLSGTIEEHYCPSDLAWIPGGSTPYFLHASD